MGPTRKSAVVIVTSGLPPKADSSRTSLHVRKVPTGDIFALFAHVSPNRLAMAPICF
jgi:hypothetical protein